MKAFISAIVGLGIAVAVVLGIIWAIISFVSWNNNHQTARGRGDAPTGQVNTDPRQVYQMPDAFSNVAMFCDKYGNAVYVTTKTDSSRAVWALKDGCQ